MTFKFYRLKNREYCPYCNNKCIPFRLIIFAGRIWYSPKCPNCGATLKIEHKMRILQLLLTTIAIITDIFISLMTDAYLYSFLIPSPWIILLLIDTLIALLTELDYEELWNYPKPPQYNDDDK